MSLSQTVTKAVNEVIHSYIEQVADKYELDVADLLELWEGEGAAKPAKKSTTRKAVPKKPTPPSTEGDVPDHSELKKLTKAELVALCKARGEKCTGTKAVLIGYLTGEDPEPTPSKKKSPAKKTAAAKTKAVAATPVAKKLVPKTSTVPIRRNQFGNFEHPETSFVFNNKTQKVIGKQNDNGNIDDLTPEDVDLCNKYKFSFEVPENLDKKSTLADVHVDELEDDEEYEDVDEVDNETEEELDEDDFDEEFDEDLDEEEYYDEDDD